MAYFLMGRLMQQSNKRVQAVQNFEQSARHFLKSEEYSRAEGSLAEALALAPANNRLMELRTQIEEEIAAHPEKLESERDAAITENDEKAFINWLHEVDEKLQSNEPFAAPAAAESPFAAAITGNAPAPASGITDTSEISPEDRRVALCLNDMRELDSDQIEAMRQQLISMFTDVRKSYEEGNLSDWEMRTIKEFYKSFCIAVDLHRRRQQAV
jgi:hypothetical protein